LALVYDVYTQARSIETTGRVPFPTAYSGAFGAAMKRLDDLGAHEPGGSFNAPLRPLRAALQRPLGDPQGQTPIAPQPSRELLRAWFAFEAHRSFGGLARPLLAEDKQRRYVIDEDVAIPVAKDVTIAATLIRPRAATASSTLPTLLEFTLDRATRD